MTHYILRSDQLLSLLESQEELNILVDGNIREYNNYEEIMVEYQEEHNHMGSDEFSNYEELIKQFAQNKLSDYRKVSLETKIDDCTLIRE